MSRNIHCRRSKDAYLVEMADAKPHLGGAATRITDKYLRDSRLRLRSAEGPEGSIVYRFCKKYGNRRRCAESITNLYLDQAEYELLDRLPGLMVTKSRYGLSRGSLDVYELGSEKLAIFEIEFASEALAQSFHPPAFAGTEVTGQALYSGRTLAERWA